MTALERAIGPQHRPVAGATRPGHDRQRFGRRRCRSATPCANSQPPAPPCGRPRKTRPTAAGKAGAAPTLDPEPEAAPDDEPAPFALDFTTAPGTRRRVYQVRTVTEEAAV